MKSYSFNFMFFRDIGLEEKKNQIFNVFCIYIAIRFWKLRLQ